MAKKISIELDIDTKSLGHLESMLEDVNEELKNVDRNSDAFKELAAKSQILNKEIEKINNEIEGFGLDDKIMAADGAAKVFGGSLSAVVGTLGTLGIESEAFGKFEEKATAAIAVGLGIKDVSEGFGQLTLAINKSGVASQLFGKITKRALIGTGIGALVVALGTIVAYWDEINDLVAGTNKSLEEQKKLIEKQISDSELAVELLRAEYENVVLREEVGIDITKEIKKQLLLQQEQNTLLLEALELELGRTKEENKTVSNWEKIKIGLAGAVGFGLQNKAIAEATNEESEETKELSDQIAEAKKRQLELDKQILLIDQEISKEQEFQNFLQREAAVALDIKTVGLKPMEMDKLKADVEFEDLLNKERIRQQEEFAKAVIENQAKLDSARAASLDNLIAIAGSETKVGKALLVAKQALALQELIIEAKKTITFSTQAAARSTVSIAEGTAQTAKVGFPQNIPLLIGYAAQAVGIISAMSSAVSGASSAAGGAGATPRGATSAPSAPAFNIVGAAPENQLAQAIGEKEERPVKAFVVSSEVSSQQALDRNIEGSAALG